MLVATLGIAQTRKVSDGEVKKVHRSAMLIDGHNDVTSATVDGLDLGPRRSEGHTDIVRMKEGGMTAQFFAAYVSVGSIERKDAAHRALQMIDTIRHDIVDEAPAGSHARVEGGGYTQGPQVRPDGGA